MDLDLVQFWKDERLQVPAALQLSPNPKLTLDYRYKQLFWTPPLQLTNTKQVTLNSFFEPIVFLEINNRKQVFLNAKLTLELDCNYQLSTKHRHADNKLERFGRSFGQFPFDGKECGIELISCEYDALIHGSHFKYSESGIFPTLRTTCSPSVENRRGRSRNHNDRGIPIRLLNLEFRPKSGSTSNDFERNTPQKTNPAVSN